MSDSVIVYDEKGRVTSFVGDDATNLFRAMMLKSSIRLWLDTKMIPTRGVTITKMLAMAKAYSNKSYKTTQCQMAIDDLEVWINNMRSAISVEVRT